jgi:hypothetical protein
MGNGRSDFSPKPNLLGIIDSYGIELVHPIRKGRTANGWAETGISNHRRIVGGKLCLSVNHLGQILAEHVHLQTIMTHGFIR